MKYFEIEFSNTVTEDDNNYFICIKGIREPSIAEANIFLREDIKNFEAPVIRVDPIAEDVARDCYDFTNVNHWPVFQ